MTYLAGLEAQTVVWISEEFTEPHLSAIRWLNEHTAEPFSFLAVRLSLVRITDSPIAPRFEVVERPNSWDRMVRASPHTGELSETGAFRREFWTYYSERYPEDVPQAYATSNVWVYVPAADFNISLMLARRRVGLFLRGSQGESAESVYERALPLGPLGSAGGVAADGGHGIDHLPVGGHGQLVAKVKNRDAGQWAELRQHKYPIDSPYQTFMTSPIFPALVVSIFNVIRPAWQ